MEQFLSSNNPSHNRNSSAPESNKTSPQTTEVAQEVHEYIPSYELAIEILKIIGVNAEENDFTVVEGEYFLSNNEIKSKVFNEIISELGTFQTSYLEFALHNNLLTRREISTKKDQLREYAIAILQQKKNQERHKEASLFIEAGILSEQETKDIFYLLKR